MMVNLFGLGIMMLHKMDLFDMEEFMLVFIETTMAKRATVIVIGIS